MAGLFERLNAERPTPKEAIEQRGYPSSEKLLAWLNSWAQPTISARQVYTYGPNCIRNKKTALRLAGILIEQGQLVPLKMRRRDRHEWQIVRK